MRIRRLVDIPASQRGDPLAIDDPPQGIAPPVPTVGELTRQIAQLLEGEFADIAVQGEISTWTRAPSGHTYFTLKDTDAVLSGVMWKSRRQEHPIEAGMRVVACGRISLYAPRGQYQLDCTSIAPLGIGDLQAEFEALKKRLLTEGLFALERKRPLPLYPSRIGVVTSRTGAAVRDIFTTLRRRMPLAEVILRPVLVQGTTAAQDIANGIADLNKIEGIDIIIVGRGGGSIEDLWAFNTEVVARAIAASAIPIVSAVGHEVDFTIADFVADLRAATPTAAAELVVRNASDILLGLIDLESDIDQRLLARIAHDRRRLEGLLRSRGLSRPLDTVNAHGQRLDDLTHRAIRGLQSISERATGRLELLTAKLDTLNPTNVLARGYAIIERDGVPISSSGLLGSGDSIVLRMHDGNRQATIDDSKP